MEIIVALFTIANVGEQHKCQSPDEEIKEMRNADIIGYNSV
jgi:hypothetical protein